MSLKRLEQSRAARLAIPCVIFAAAFLTFLPSLRNGWVNWDDDHFILANPYLRGFGAANVRWMFSTRVSGVYLPLTWLSQALDYRIWGLNPLGFHLTNLLLHCANSVLFYFLARRLLMRTGTLGSPGTPFLWPALAALLFAVHPLRVESVVWASERKDVLSGFFYLLAILAYLRFAEEGRHKTAHYLLALAAYAASLLSKAVTISLPAALTIMDLYPLRRLPPDPSKWFPRSRKAIWTEKIPFWGLALAFGAIGLAAQDQQGAMRSLRDYGVLDRMAQACSGTMFYPLKTIFPFLLSPLYALPSHLSLLSLPILLSFIGMLAITAFCLVMARQGTLAPIAAWLFYLATLFPTLGLIQFGPQWVACRYSYLACLVWPILIVGASRRFPPVMALLSVATVGLGVLTWRQTEIWHDSNSLWTQAISLDADNAIARHNLGLALAEQGYFAEASVQFQESIRIDPLNSEDWNNLGLTLAARNMEQEAVEEYQEALKLDPNNAFAHNNLGLAFLHQGNVDQAAANFRAAIESRPDFAEARNNLGIVLAASGKRSEAVAEFEEALRLKPDYSEARANLAKALEHAGQP